jgi:hypothetical protein
MNSFDSGELAKQTIVHLNTYIKVADQKASILLTAQFAFLGFSVTVINDILPATSPEFRMFAALGAVSGLAGAFFSGAVVFPRTPKARTGFIFWEHILEFESREKFQDNFNNLSDEDALHELTKQNYSLAKVAEQKYQYLRYSLFSTAAMVVFAVVAGFIHLM